MRFLGKLILLIPFFFLLFNLINGASYPSSLLEFYYLGFLLLVGLGLVGILLNNILGVIYVLIGFGLYTYFYDRDIYNLWAVGGLILLMSRSEKVSAVPEKVSAPEKINKPVKKVKPVVEKKKVEEIKLEEVWNKYDKPKSNKVDDYWVRYDRERDKNKPIFIKLKNKINKLLGSVGL